MRVVSAISMFLWLLACVRVGINNGNAVKSTVQGSLVTD